MPALCLKLCSVLATSLFSVGKKSPLGGSSMRTRHAEGFVANNVRSGFAFVPKTVVGGRAAHTHSIDRVVVGFLRGWTGSRRFCPDKIPLYISDPERY